MLLGDLNLLRRRRSPDHRSSEVLRHLHNKTTFPTCGSVDQHDLARLDLVGLDERLGRYALQDETCTTSVGNTLWELDRLGCGGRTVQHSVMILDEKMTNRSPTFRLRHDRTSEPSCSITPALSNRW